MKELEQKCFWLEALALIRYLQVEMTYMRFFVRFGMKLETLLKVNSSMYAFLAFTFWKNSKFVYINIFVPLYSTSFYFKHGSWQRFSLKRRGGGGKIAWSLWNNSVALFNLLSMLSRKIIFLKINLAVWYIPRYFQGELVQENCC